MVVEDPTKVRRARTVRVLVIPIFCGIFSFCHWFIFFPLMWTYLSKHGMKRFWLFALIVFLMWLLVMALCLTCWWYDKKRQYPIQARPIGKDATSTLEYRSNGNFNSPSFKTKSSVIQPGYKEKSAYGFDSDKDLISMRSIPAQPQNTPSLYNLHTGRHSYDSTDIRNSLLDSAQKVNPDQVSKEVLLVKKDNNLKFKNISSSDSEKSSKTALNERPGGYELLLTTQTEGKPRVNDNGNHTVQAIIEQPIHERDILLRTKYNHCASAQEATKVRLSSNSEDDEELFKHIDMDIRLSDQNISRRNSSGRLFSQSGEIEHLKECNTPDADKLSQNMPEFDDYLHIVSIDTPLSPREVFFSDLIKQANETEQKLLRNKEGGADRRSYCIGDITYNKLNYDNRKSVPLFLYSDQWRKDSQTVEDPEQSVDSDDNQELQQLVVEPDDETSQNIEHIRQAEPKESDVKVVEMSPKKKDCDDLKMVTQMFINEEKLRYCSSPIVKPRPEAGNRRDVEQFDGAHKPRFPKDKPLKLTERVADQVVEPKPKPKPKPKPVTNMKEVSEPEILKSQAKPGCCDEEPDLRKHGETETSTGNKRKSSSEYFIAAVDGRGPQSVTSEVFLTVGASGLVSVPNSRPHRSDQLVQKTAVAAPIDLGTWSDRGKQDIKRELSQDKLEYKSEDDEVFEDVQSALTKLRRHK